MTSLTKRYLVLRNIIIPAVLPLSYVIITLAATIDFDQKIKIENILKNKYLWWLIIPTVIWVVIQLIFETKIKAIMDKKDQEIISLKNKNEGINEELEMYRQNLEGVHIRGQAKLLDKGKYAQALENQKIFDELKPSI